MDPRAVLNGGTLLHEKFVKYWVNNLPDVSDRPDIKPEKIRFWMMDDKTSSRRSRKGKKKRYPAAHSRLSGMRGKPCNDAIDFGIESNKWCVIFKDADGVTVNLVDVCIAYCWLYYIAQMVSASRVRQYFSHVYVKLTCNVYVKVLSRLRQIV